MEIVEITHSDTELISAWDKFVESARNSHFMFYRDYMEYHSDRFSDFSIVIFDDKDRVVALLPANINGATLYSHQGLTFGGFLVGEKIRDRAYSGNKWRNYSGLFILLKQKVNLAKDKIREGVDKTIAFIKRIVLGFPVSVVRT